MIIIDEERASDSPFVERIWRSHSEGERAFLSIAVNHCEFVVSRLQLLDIPLLNCFITAGLSSFRFCTRQRLFLEAYYSYLCKFGHETALKLPALW
jgi:hypothetical protein